jgi:hypothetical protein
MQMYVAVFGGYSHNIKGVNIFSKLRGLWEIISEVISKVSPPPPPMARQPLGGLGRLIFRGFTITHFRHTTLGRAPLDGD